MDWKIGTYSYKLRQLQKEIIPWTYICLSVSYTIHNYIPPQLLDFFFLVVTEKPNLETSPCIFHCVSQSQV